jgi:tRNA A37 threonylcarbamoyladenosine biosynthesis protein TsaE
LINEYHGRLDMAHVDLYRLASGDAADLGLEEYVEQNWVVVLEWPERDEQLAEQLRGTRLIRVAIDLVSATEREITIEETRE